MDSFVTVLKWHDKRDLLIISTCHGKEMMDDMVMDSNDAKKGIDVADQLSCYHFPLRKSMTWYKKVAYDLIFQTAIVNTKVIFEEATGSSISVLDVQEAMIRHWLGNVFMKKNSQQEYPLCLQHHQKDTL